MNTFLQSTLSNFHLPLLFHIVQIYEGYEKAKGKQIGFRSLQDDPKLVHFMNVAKMQSDREYKRAMKPVQVSHTPLDMRGGQQPRNLRRLPPTRIINSPFHHYTLLPDALNVEHSRNAMQIQSDVRGIHQTVSRMSWPCLLVAHSILNLVGLYCTRTLSRIGGFRIFTHLN